MPRLGHHECDVPGSRVQRIGIPVGAHVPTHIHVSTRPHHPRKLPSQLLLHYVANLQKHQRQTCASKAPSRDNAGRVAAHAALSDPHPVVRATAETMPASFNPPDGYHSPRFPSLNVKALTDPTKDREFTLYYIKDVWKFTVTWTLITYALFHLGAVVVALLTHRWKKSSLTYMWAVPLVYLVTAGLEALLAGSVVGLMFVEPIAVRLDAW